MDDNYAIDRHKIQYHVDALNNWLQKREVYPIYVEISPAGSCNHRCSFCAVDYIGYKHQFLNTEVLKKRLEEMARLGVKSVMFAGEGEPLLHKSLPEIICHAHTSGIDVSITTNAVPMTEKWSKAVLPYVTWLKVSINAGSAEMYSKIHQTQAEDFNKVIRNIEIAASMKKTNQWNCAIGSQMVLLPENWNEAFQLAHTLKSIGCDYLVIKPYSQHKSSITREFEGIDYNGFEALKQKMETLTDDNFSVIFRDNAFKKLKDSDFYYTKCQATPYFWAYIMADGSVYGCSAYLLDDRFCYGNINENFFQEIWEGEKRRQNIEFVEKDLDITNCRKNCRMDEVNRYLWDLVHPPEHVNFI